MQAILYRIVYLLPSGHLGAFGLPKIKFETNTLQIQHAQQENHAIHPTYITNFE